MKNLLSIIFLFSLIFAEEHSICYGTTSKGSLENGVLLPIKGKNFIAYSSFAHLTGRTYVHSTVRSIMLKAYKALEKEHPQKVYKYAETGFKNGGTFKPHKTHKNGLSVDFMTPVIDKSKKSVHLPTHALNKFGYAIEFNKDGDYKQYKIDFTALAAHIVFLHKEAKRQGHDLWRVIFDPNLQPKLFETKYGDYLRQHIKFSKKRSWVRHDEHYHIDFAVACK